MTSQVTLHAFAPPSSTTTRPKQISVMLSLEAAKATVRSAESHAAGWKNRKKKKKKNTHDQSRSLAVSPSFGPAGWSITEETGLPLYRAVVWNKGGKRDASKKRKKDSKMFEGEESPFVQSRRGGGHGQIAIRKTNRVGKKHRALQRFLNALSLHKGITSMILT